MSAGVMIQSIEFMDDGVVSFTWAMEEDVESEAWGEIRKTWVDTKLLPDFVADNLNTAVHLLLDEYHAWKRNAPDTIEP